jgi:ketosteroid isomerase-like protein
VRTGKIRAKGGGYCAVAAAFNPGNLEIGDLCMKNTIIAIVMIAAAAVSVAAECSEADKKALIAFDKDWTAANQRGERNTIAAFYADEFMTFPNMINKTASVDAAVAAFARNKANPQAVATTVTDHYQITCSPLTATIIHRNTTTPAGGKGQPAYSRSVHFLENDNDMLRYMELDWIDAVKTRNFDWFEKNYASDFTEVSFVTGAVNNRQQAIDGMRSDKTVFDVMEVSDLRIRVDGNTAIVIGLGYGRGKMGDGKPFDIKLRFTDTYIKRDGRWQAWASSATMIPAADASAKN